MWRCSLTLVWLSLGVTCFLPCVERKLAWRPLSFVFMVSCDNSALISWAECLFLLLAKSFGANQDLALQDYMYIQSSLMLKYNRKYLYSLCASYVLLFFVFKAYLLVNCSFVNSYWIIFSDLFYNPTPKWCFRHDCILLIWHSCFCVLGISPCVFSEQKLDEVASKVKEKWKLVAKSLGIPDFRVAQWQEENDNDASKCISLVFDWWKKHQCRYKCAKLLDILENPDINQKELATEIRSQVSIIKYIIYLVGLVLCLTQMPLVLCN